MHNTAQTDWRQGAAWFLPQNTAKNLMNGPHTSEIWSVTANIDTGGQADDIILEVIKNPFLNSNS